MSKEKVEDNPFSAFTIMNGGIVPPIDKVVEAIDDDIKAGDDALLEEEVPELDEETLALKRGDEALKKVIEKQTKKTEVKAETEEVDVDTDDEEETIEEDSLGYKTALEDLANRGILDFDSTKITDSEEGFDTAIEQTVLNRLQKKIAGYGDEALDFLTYLEQGGNPRQFIDTYYNNQSWADYKIDENESAQKVALRESLRLDGETPEDIEDIITTYEDSGKLETRAKSALSKLQRFEAEQKVELLEAQKVRAAEEQERQKQVYDGFKTELYSKQDIKGFKVTEKVKNDLWSFMTSVDRKSGKTAYQKAIEDNKDSSLLFAYIAMKNFDIEKLEKQVVSKASSKVAGILKNYKPSTKERISGGRTEVEPEGDSPFSGFKKM